MKFIGITGGIGAGKSELLTYIRKHYKCKIYLADEVAHLLMRRGSVCYEALAALLGSEVVGEDGELDRAVMSEKIFADGELLRQVNEMVHPAVKTFLLERLTQAKAAGNVELFFVEAALLIECGYVGLVDEMWYVYADEAVRRERLRRDRGYSEEKISEIMSRQLTDEVFRKNSDFVIDNSGPIEDSYGQIDKQLEAYTWRE